MANKWFKFFGGEYLSDPKMLALTASERSCWVTLLCYASMSDQGGKIQYLEEEKLMLQSGVDFQNEEWEKTKKVLVKFEKLKMIHLDNDMITIINWEKRQETSLTPYERVKRYREKKRNDAEMITTDKNRIDKNRIDNTYIAFDEFWNLYPKHVGKQKARQYWEQLKYQDQKKAIEDIPKRMFDRKWVGGFIKDPERYIKNEQWNDDILVDKQKITDKKVDRFTK